MASAVLNPFTGAAYSPRCHELVAERASLPIHARKEHFAKALDESQLLLIEAQVGAGKSTQIPQWAVKLAAGKLVACSQPRRATPPALAARVAEEMDVELGKEVGYAIRNEERAGSALKYCTDGWLLREIKRSPLLEDYGVVIVDEMQERTLYTDLLIYLLREMLKTRKDIKIVLMGRDATRWAQHMGHCAVLPWTSPALPTEIVYSPLHSVFPFDAAVETIIDLHTKDSGAGTILFFLAMPDEVERACEEISCRVKALGAEVGPLDCIPLYAGLPAERLKRIYSPAVGRKCVVSTHIGESGFVFGDIEFVVDEGFLQQEVYDPATHTDCTRSMPISQAQADIRARRASKKAIRLYSQVEYEEMEKETQPEIRRANPEKVRMMLKEYGIEDVANIDPASR